MYELFKSVSLLKHSTVQIECIASYDDYLFLGTRQGFLYMYNIVPSSTDDKHEVQLISINKTFSKKPIQQLDVIREHNLLISLSDNLIQVHDIQSPNCAVVSTVDRSKGATLFTVDCNIKETLTGEKTSIYRMCVAVKRKLQFYVLKKSEFIKLEEDISVVDVPKALAWGQDTICVGNKSEYFWYKFKEGWHNLFPTSSKGSTDPYIVKASDTTFALVKDNQTFLVNDKGGAEKSRSLKWSDVPQALIWDDPYCVALIGDSCEVHAIEAEEVLQQLKNMNKVRFVSRAKQGVIYVASITEVWVLQAVNVAVQRKILLDSKQFELALKLTEIYDETVEEKKKIIYEIQTCLAYDLFEKKQYMQSMDVFLKMGSNLFDVLVLFPDLLPQQSSAKIDQAWPLKGKDLENALLALIKYLTGRRFICQLEAEKNIKQANNMSDIQVIDTTLLKCYLQTNDALVAPLLRSNNCHLAEAERTLKKYNKNNELIILYQMKGQHRKALELLKSEDNAERTILYLQHLGSKDLGLIFEYADWVLKNNPEEGLKIFTEDLMEFANASTLPRPRVLDYLLKSHMDLAIPYLEHVIHAWNDQNHLFHNSLIHKYREKALSGDSDASDVRKKLVEFLESSPFYNPETVLMHFPSDKLLDERALIVGKLGQHDKALAIYVRALGDIKKAKDYCKRVCNGGKNNGSVYISLIKILLKPDECDLNLPGVALNPVTGQPDLETALNLLEECGAFINPLDVLEVFPQNIPVARVYKFLQVAFQRNLKERRQAQLLKGLLYAEHLQQQEMRLALESQSILLTDMNICPVCRKRFGKQSALVRYPNGDVVHYSCQEKKL